VTRNQRFAIVVSLAAVALGTLYWLTFDNIIKPRVAPGELLRAVDRDDIEAVQRLLSEGADVNEKNDSGWSALALAARNSNAKTVSLLLSKGADINAKTPSIPGGIKEPPSGGYNPLHLTSKIGVAKLLLEKGTYVNARDNFGATPLMHAVWDGHSKLLRFLLQKGADVNARDNRGKTVLFWAVMRNSPEMVRILLRSGASVHKQGETGTILQLARAKGYKEITELLKAHGAKQ
jgi:ankyrin repeat protein